MLQERQVREWKKQDREGEELSKGGGLRQSSTEVAGNSGVQVTPHSYFSLWQESWAPDPSVLAQDCVCVHVFMHMCT